MFNNHPYATKNVDKIYLGLGPTTIMQLQTQAASFRALYNYSISLSPKYHHSYARLV
jgi:hypothetical protein